MKKLILLALISVVNMTAFSAVTNDSCSNVTNCPAKGFRVGRQPITDSPLNTTMWKKNSEERMFKTRDEQIDDYLKELSIRDNVPGEIEVGMVRELPEGTMFLGGHQWDVRTYLEEIGLKDVYGMYLYDTKENRGLPVIYFKKSAKDIEAVTTGKAKYQITERIDNNTFIISRKAKVSDMTDVETFRILKKIGEDQYIFVRIGAKGYGDFNLRKNFYLNLIKNW